MDHPDAAAAAAPLTPAAVVPESVENSNSNAPITTTRGRRVNVVKVDSVLSKAQQVKKDSGKKDDTSPQKIAKEVTKKVSTKQTKLAGGDVNSKATAKAAASSSSSSSGLTPCPNCGGVTPFCAMTGQPHAIKALKPKATPKPKPSTPKATAEVVEIGEDEMLSSLLAATSTPPVAAAAGVKRPRSAKPTSGAKTDAIDADAVDGQPVAPKRKVERKPKATTATAAAAPVDVDDDDLPLTTLASVEVVEAPPGSTKGTKTKKAATRQTTLNFSTADGATPKTEIVIPPPPVKPFKPCFNKVSHALAKSILMDSIQSAAEIKKAAATADSNSKLQSTIGEDAGATSTTAIAETSSSSAVVAVDGSSGEATTVVSNNPSAPPPPPTSVDPIRTSRTYLTFIYDFLSERSKYEIVRGCMSKNGGALPEKYAKRIGGGKAAAGTTTTTVAKAKTASSSSLSAGQAKLFTKTPSTTKANLTPKKQTIQKDGEAAPSSSARKSSSRRGSKNPSPLKLMDDSEPPSSVQQTVESSTVDEQPTVIVAVGGKRSRSASVEAASA